MPSRSLLMKLTASFFVAALLALVVAQPAPVTIPDIAGDATVHQVAATGSFRSILIRAADTNSTATCSSTSLAGCVRFGDINISTTRGMYLKPGESSGWIESSGSARRLLSSWYYLVQTGDKLTIIYEQ